MAKQSKPINIPIVKNEGKIESTATPIPEEIAPEVVPITKDTHVYVSQPEADKAYKSDEMQQTSVDSLSAKFSDFKEAPKVPTIEEVKAKRGRKPGGKNAPKVPIEDFKPKLEQPVFAGAVISGLLLLTIVDTFLPWLLSVAHNRFNANKISMKDLQMPSEIKKEMSTVADEYIKTSQVKLTPGQALALSLVGAYATAYISATTKKPVKTTVSTYNPPKS